VLFGKNQSQRRVELGHLKQVLQAILDQNKAERDVSSSLSVAMTVA
jgi:hypothetical protein